MLIALLPPQPIQSAAALNALANDAVAGYAADLNGLPYYQNPFAIGMQADDFRADMHQFGERVIWLRAAQMESGPDSQAPLTNAGKVYVVQSLAPDVRVFIYQNTKHIETQDWGAIETGAPMLSFMPDEISPLRDDRFVAIDRPQPARVTLAPDSGLTRELPHARISSIDEVWIDGARLNASQYAATSTGIEWVGSAPTGEVTVFYSYIPIYEWLADNAKQAFVGTDGKRLPGNGPLRLLSAGEEI